jgi:hypothetical protein
MTIDPEKTGYPYCGPAEKAEDPSARNPVLAEMPQLGKALVEEARKRSADGRRFDPLAGYVDSACQLVVLEPQAETNAEALASSERTSRLTSSTTLA